MRWTIAASVLLCLGCGQRASELGDDASGGEWDATGDAGETGDTGSGGTTGHGPKLDVGERPGDDEIDILFVVDNSFSMRHETLNVARNMLGIWEDLQALEDAYGEPFLPAFDVHMMVTTTDVGGPHCESVPGYEAAGGAPVRTGCNARANEFVRDGVDVFEACAEVCPADVLPDAPFIHLQKGGGSNVPGDAVGTALACLGTQGIAGCEHAQPLEAMRRALDPDAVWNLGDDAFLRDGSVVVVALITDAPDCSVANPEIFADETLMNVNPDSGQPEPSPAVCWNAGVDCIESDTPGLYDDCSSSGTGLSSVDGYLEFLQEDLSEEYERDVLMVAALGVPEVWQYDPNPPFEPIAGGILELVYRDWRDGEWPLGDVLPGEPTTAAEQQWFNGIGPGCTGEDGMGGFSGQAMPPVRAAEVCQGLDEEGLGGVRCCIESICDPDFAHMMRCMVGIQVCPLSDGDDPRCEWGG